ncbi:outer membrane protein assembly factor BamE [Ferribacterium limneticum]|uniref:outer membrane protein assembly factor BamE n=1 Tax=Ferribacterium limneticum TaxID=76259 RepID=UPI001CFA6FFA|nr:outer membrane protein assembly factor BamE [Ferribacterium limneticum]UCV27479.1 outer membrane protein assembly factor BamE [Ferribacterium limneticum]UCV31396.1 outer membrane protein assembly factor BamE [Ferribacterium limneticum]
MRRSRLLLVAASCALITACSYKPSFINEYKIDIQQGNVLSQEMVSQLKPGQTRDQVRFLLGTPLVADIFHHQRWDYVYRYQNGQTGRVESRKLAVFFDAEGRLERVDGDVAVADAGELNAPVAKGRLVDLGTLSGEAADKPLPPREEPSFFRRVMNMFGF